ncbi:MAG: hypothetical protein V1802_01690 [Candidatus Aenigmatarchaeota archaeon]
MFLISAIIVSFGLFALTGIVIKSPYMPATSIDDRQMENILNEYESLTFMPAEKERIFNATSNFSSYLRKNLDINMFYVLVFPNATDQKYYISIGNFLDVDVQVTLNITSPNEEHRFTMKDENITERKFEFITSGNPVIIKINYIAAGKNSNETIIFDTNRNNTRTGFFDISMNSVMKLHSKKTFTSSIEQLVEVPKTEEGGCTDCGSYCSDGTPSGSCSGIKYCDNGNIITSCRICPNCPDGFSCMSNGACGIPPKDRWPYIPMEV